MTKQTKTFQDLFQENFKQLDLYTTAITRAHGKSHPVTFDIREIFVTITEKMKESADTRPNLKREFTELRLLTHNYLIPEAVCGTYITVYDMLSELDTVYNNEENN